MKTKCLVLILMILLLARVPWGGAERVHHWVDSKGHFHLSQEPPPADGKLIEIMEYPVSQDKPAPTDRAPSGNRPQYRYGNDIVEHTPGFEKWPQPKADIATSCYISAELDDVYVYVIDYTDPDRVLDKVLYRGNIPKDQKQIIESSSGKIKYSYQRSSDDRTYGDNRAECVNGRKISIP